MMESSSSTYISLFLGTESLMLELEVMDTLIDLITEQVVEDSVCCCHYDVSVLQLLTVVFSMLWQILAHIAIAPWSKYMSKLFELFNPPLLLKDCELLLSW